MLKHRATSEAFRQCQSFQPEPFADIKASWYFDDCDADSRTVALCKWVRPHLELERILHGGGLFNSFWLKLHLERIGKKWELEATLSFPDTSFSIRSKKQRLVKCYRVGWTRPNTPGH